MGSKLRRGWPPLAVIVVFLAMWEGAVGLLGIPAYQLPAPTAIAREALSPAVFGRLRMHTAATLLRTLEGLSIGTAVGLAIAFALHLIPGARRGFTPILVLSQNVPVIVLGPLLAFWFGFGELPKVILVVLVCFFPVTVAMLTGLEGGDRHLRNYLAMAGASRWTVFARLELPNSVPHLFAGLRISAAYSVGTAVVAEYFGADKGLGYFISLSRSGFQAERMFAGILLVVGFSLLFYGAASLLERRFGRWRRAADAAEKGAGAA